MNSDNTDWCQQVLNFWFDELTNKDWFVASKALDETICDRYTQTHQRLSEVSELPPEANPQWALAAVIVLDQFSRNMHRGSKDAFAFDPLALSFTKQAIEKQLEQNFNDDEKQFLYMPFMHSENLDDQQKCVSLFTAIGRPEHAVEHMEIVQQFGRFPHRNEVLGRDSTTEEIEYLKEARRFGQ